MTTFRIGQRIKKVRGKTNVGTVAIVIAVNVAWHGSNTLQVKRDEPWKNQKGVTFQACESSFTDPDNWEPIADSNTLVSWESMRDLWVPEHLRVEA
jgi:hypothetical protein